MLRRRFNRTCLSPHDLAICERVFEQACSDENLDPLDPDAEILAVMVVSIFRNAHTSERELLEAVRSRRQKAPGGASHQLFSRDAL
ncbi:MULTISPECIES: hypothetical protein [Mesorhizobium]|uniref:Msr6711 protein n=2 Tax=Mesorhizobium japonicum TaxID=2066070 RepID=Q988J9_RHILO|nr:MULTISPECIES: hypothetical protein [Mesorhizobium]ETA71349.1 hypothetical protein MesloDRAFT_0186 [Mesorhizobium japonicum R7A]MBE1711747.1 hypothetical protein [Mesorhizobium japonicum]MBE1717701.1 hypothetical protein [Mesorhizobium japonicum]MUT23608.1 hypothetical protein [Mesorhizobium japonicum]MUT30400.1 hypothetical protein [Mesorhizobium japonicum]